MSSYQHEGNQLTEVDVDVDFVLGVPAQATPAAAETMSGTVAPPRAASDRVYDHVIAEPVAPPREPMVRHAKRPSDDAAWGAVGLGSVALALCLIPVVNLLALAMAAGGLVAGVVAVRHARTYATETLRLAVIGVALSSVAGLGAIGSALTYGGGPSTEQVARANGAATTAVLAQDLGVTVGAYSAGIGLPVTLTNTASERMSYNVSVVGIDPAGRSVGGDVAFTGALAPGASTTVTMFANASGAQAVELGVAQFRVAEASSY